MFCPNCGKAEVEDMKFCSQCGQRLIGSDLEEKQRYIHQSETPVKERNWFDRRKARTGVGRFIQIVGFIIWLGCGFATCVLIFGLIADAAGTWVAVVGFIFFPALFGLAPLIYWLITGTFPLLYLILWLVGWGAMLIILLGIRVKGEQEEEW